MATLTIERLGRLGDGIAADGTAVPLALPGETVSADPPHPRLDESPDRQRPPCRHFGSCGGCAVQHASDALVARWKAETVRRALAARGLDAPLAPGWTAPAGSRRRAVLAGRRTKSGAEIGFHARRSDRIVPLSECPVLCPDLAALLPALAPVVRAGASRKGVLGLALAWTGAGADLDVRGGKPLDLELRARLAALAAEAGLARLSWAGETVAEARRPGIAMGAAHVVPPPGAFLQAVAEAEEEMAADVAQAVGAARRVVDLYAGCGPFALRLAARAEVHAVEGAGAMLSALDAAWRAAPGLRRVTTETRDLARRPLRAAELARFDAAVIDPPRAGAPAQTAEIAASPLARVAAVSCDPVSFARDAACLVAAGFRLERVRVIDQFRWSPHVELTAAFSR